METLFLIYILVGTLYCHGSTEMSDFRNRDKTYVQTCFHDGSVDDRDRFKIEIVKFRTVHR